MPQKVVVSEFMDEAPLAAFRPEITVHYDPTLVDEPDRLRESVADAEALIVRNRTRVDRALLEAAPGLRVVGRLGVGLENIDLEACAAHGVVVKPATGANTQSVVEYVIGSMLVLRRGAFSASPDVLSGDWPRGALGAGGEVQGLTLGLLGFGAIAQAVSHVARALSMTIAAFDPYLGDGDAAWSGVRRCELAELLQTADVLSLHIPLTEGTASLLGVPALSQMKQGAILINTARGGIVDEPALADALRAGRLAGAAMDVFAQEPLDKDAAGIFAGAPNLILTPHIAGVTREANSRVSQVTVQNVLEVLSAQSG